MPQENQQDVTSLLRRHAEIIQRAHLEQERVNDVMRSAEYGISDEELYHGSPASAWYARPNTTIPLTPDELSFFDRELRDIPTTPMATPSGISYALRYRYEGEANVNSALDTLSAGQIHNAAFNIDYAFELGDTGHPRRSSCIGAGTPLFTIHVGESEDSLQVVLGILHGNGWRERAVPLETRVRSTRGTLVASNVVVAKVVTLCHGGTFHVDRNYHTTGAFDDEQWVRDTAKVFPNAL